MTDIELIADEAAANFPWGDDIALRDPLAAYKACARHAALAALASAQSDVRELVEAAFDECRSAAFAILRNDHYFPKGQPCSEALFSGVAAATQEAKTAALAKMEARTDV
tara:strand:+ start:5614 stop:5943 length:330 start_codon:yes stop_codon:yes gene_type:complete